MPKPVVYMMDLSAPCLSVLVTAHALGVDVKIRNVDLQKQENRTEEYIKMNPQHTIPVLDDNGFILADSHAINIYLVDRYGKDDTLYPKDVQKRALVNQYLFFDTDTLFRTHRDAIMTLFLTGKKTISQELIQSLKEAREILEKHLKGKEWLVGDSYTLADIACVFTVNASSVVKGLDNYPNIMAWLQRCLDELPGFKEIGLPGKKALQNYVNKITS